MTVGWWSRAALPEPIAQTHRKPQRWALSAQLTPSAPAVQLYSKGERALCFQGEEGMLKLAAGKDAVGWLL